ncbi:Vacuolar protein sorting-associated protein 5 [Blyttiomyces sp. JEL0837]|nr:Vacuolar protein sorting-associated protein 5 [Blyttiomyces sp. JEL0837]
MNWGDDELGSGVWDDAPSANIPRISNVEEEEVIGTRDEAPAGNAFAPFLYQTAIDAHSTKVEAAMFPSKDEEVSHQPFGFRDDPLPFSPPVMPLPTTTSLPPVSSTRNAPQSRSNGHYQTPFANTNATMVSQPLSVVDNPLMRSAVTDFTSSFRDPLSFNPSPAPAVKGDFEPAVAKDIIGNRNSTDNASIVPIAPSDTGTIRSYDANEDSEFNQTAISGLSLDDDGKKIGGALGDLPSDWSRRAGEFDTLDPLSRAVKEIGEDDGSSDRRHEVDHENIPIGGGTQGRTELFSFEVNISDPQKVGADLINAHVIYKVKTKTNAPQYRNPEFSVQRRYRDFLWLHNQLTDKYPGAIIPPVPEKHAIGRFQDDFVESRRAALERCVRKITTHPVLQTDDDVRMFLESETFNVDMNQRKRDDAKVSGGFMSAFTASISPSPSPSVRIPEDDPAKQDISNILGTVDEYLRFVTSIKNAFASRVKAYQNKQSLELSLQRKKEMVEKLKASSKIRSDKISVGEGEIAETVKLLADANKEFANVSALLKSELRRYDHERVLDFISSLQAFMQSLIATQREIVRLWESYYDETGQQPPQGQGRKDA